MTIFFALGALGGSMSALMQGRDLWTSTHFTTAVAGLVLLLLQGMLSAFFEVRRRWAVGGGRWAVGGGRWAVGAGHQCLLASSLIP